MADVINAAKDSGNYTPEDEIMIHKKAYAIINCYIDSSVPPKIQVTTVTIIILMILNRLMYLLILYLKYWTTYIKDISTVVYFIEQLFIYLLY